jgi:hypothetical protein
MIDDIALSRFTDGDDGYLTTFPKEIGNGGTLPRIKSPAPKDIPE